MSFLDELSPTEIKGDQHAVLSAVSNPETSGLGRSKVTDYLVTTNFANESESLVRRTWEDFEWIQKQLVEERAGIIVPVLPPKKAINARNKFSEAFTHECQLKLDRFVRRVVSHKELVDAPCLLPFFTASPNDWKTTKETTKTAEEVEASNHSSVNAVEGDPSTVVISAEQEAPQQKKVGMFGKWMATKRDQWALRKNYLVLEESPADSKKFEDLKTYCEHLETCIQILAEDSKDLFVSQQQQSEKMKTMGAAFTQLWGEHELSSTSTSNMYQSVGDCWTKLCKQWEGHFTFGNNQLSTPLDELYLDVIALKEALAKRKKVVYEYTKRVQEGRKLQQQMDRMRSSDLSEQGDQYFNLERDIRISDVDVAERKKMTELITDRLFRDVERFRVEWHERMREVLHCYHEQHLKFLKDQTAVCEQTLPNLTSIAAERAALPTGAQKVVAPELSVSYTTSGATATINDSTPIEPQSGSTFAVTLTDSVMDTPDSVGASDNGLANIDVPVIDESLPMGAPPASAPPIPPNA